MSASKLRWMVSLFLFSFWLLCGANSSVSKSIHKLDAEIIKSTSANTSACVIKYLRDFFDAIKSARKAIYLLTNNGSNDPVSVEGHFLMEVHETESEWLSIQLFSQTESVYSSLSDPNAATKERRDFVFFHDDTNAERAMDRLMIDDQLGADHLHVIFVENHTEERISAIFTALLKTRFGRNVNVLVQRDVAKWTWLSDSAMNENCGRSGASVVAEFHWNCNECIRVDAKRSQNVPMGTNQRCQLKVAGIESPPYTYYDEEKGFYKGIEYFMIETLAQKLHFDIVYRFVNTSNNLDEFNELNLGTLDMMVGGFAQKKQFTDSFATSIEYVQDDLTWCVRRADPLPEYLNIFRVNDWKVWLLLMSTIFVGSILMFLFSRSDHLFNRRNKNSHYMLLLTMFPIVMGIGVNAKFQPKRNAFRFFFGICVFCGMMGIAVWNSFLLRTTLHTFRSTQISSIDQLLENKFQLSASTSSLSVIFDQDKYPTHVVDRFNICDNIDECMATLAWNRYSAVTVARKRAFNCPTVAKEDIYCFDKTQNIRNIGISLVARPRFEHMPVINRMLRYLVESGLFAKWERDSSSTVYKDNSDAFNYNRITWKHFGGGMIYLFLGLFFGLVAFCLEIIIHRCARLHRRSKFWKVTERLIDGHRYELL